MNYKLHYAKLNSTSDISCLEFNSKYQLLEHVESLYKKHWLTSLNFVCLVEVDKELIVVSSMKRILDFINNELWDNEFLSNDMFGFDVSIHEYNSYQDAYKAAILLKEESELCYSDNVDLDLYPVYFNGQQYQKEQCSELFISVYTDRFQLNDSCGIYLGDGCSVYPDGSID